MVDLAKELDLDLDPALKTANAALFHLRNRYAIILKKLAAIDGDERLSAKAKANDRALVIGAEGSKAFHEAEKALRELAASQTKAQSAWIKAANQGSSDPRMMAARPRCDRCCAA